MMPPRPPRRDDGRRGLDGAPIGGETPDDYERAVAAPVTPLRRPLSESPNPRLRAMTTRARVRRLAKLIEELRHEEVPEHAIELVTGYHARLTVQADELEDEADRRLEAERAEELERQAPPEAGNQLGQIRGELNPDGSPTTGPDGERVSAWDDLGGRP